MNLSIKTIFLQENEENIFQALQNQGIDTSKFEYHFIDLFNKMYNNEVGYYIFKQDEQIYKIIILPKTIDEKSPTAQKEFVNYLLHYHRVNNKYNFDKIKQIPNSLLSLAFEENNQDKNNSHNPIEEFEYYKYKSIIKSIEIFFKRHKNYKRVQVDYKSQDIKYKLNLSKNIKELDKTKIHQTRSLDILYSQIATITYDALKLFAKRKINIIKDEQYKKQLIQETKKVINFIAKKYPIDKNYKFSLLKLYSTKTAKVYSTKSDTKLLLVNIKSLFGFEQMYQDNEVHISNRYDLTTTSFFINPSIFYEWYVYDILKKYTDASAKSILFDKKEGTATQYYLNKEPKSSNPDYILTDEVNKVKIVIDAKWKNVNEFGDIKPSDYLKLKFDVSLLEKDGFGTVSYLVYPNVNIADRIFEIKLEDREIYRFNTLEIDMNFSDKEKNSLSFNYDFKQQAKEIADQEEKESIRQSAIDSSKTMQPERDSVIQQLINAESTEEKEVLGGLFDETLWQQNEQLVKTLNVEIILSEVKEILVMFRDSMEEESITFLKSASTIYAHYRDEENLCFDYSMPGSGLWKLIEVELNTSFVRYIRYKEGVISSSSSWDAIIHADKEINIKWVKLNERDKDNRLKGLMFGQLKFLSRNDYAISLFNGIVEYDFDEQWTILDKVVKYRNEHAHIKAMSKDIFEELWGLLFKKDDTGMNELQKLLTFKQKMKVYIDE